MHRDAGHPRTPGTVGIVAGGVGHRAQPGLGARLGDQLGGAPARCRTARRPCRGGASRPPRPTRSKAPPAGRTASPARRRSRSSAPPARRPPAARRASPRTVLSRSSVKPLVPTTTCTPCCTHHRTLSSTASGRVKSTATSAPAAASAPMSSPRSTRATSSRSSAASTAEQVAEPIRPAAPSTATRSRRHPCPASCSARASPARPPRRATPPRTTSSAATARAATGRGCGSRRPRPASLSSSLIRRAPPGGAAPRARHARAGSRGEAHLDAVRRQPVVGQRDQQLGQRDAPWRGSRRCPPRPTSRTPSSTATRPSTDGVPDSIRADAGRGDVVGAPSRTRRRRRTSPASAAPARRGAARAT